MRSKLLFVAQFIDGNGARHAADGNIDGDLWRRRVSGLRHEPYSLRSFLLVVVSDTDWDDAGMARQPIRTDRAPSSSLYSQGVRTGDHIYVSGMTGTDPATGALAGPTIQEQTRQAIANCLAILEAGGAGYDDIVEVGILLTNPADFAGLNEEYARAFATDPPARYVAKLGVELPGVLVSVRMTAITS